MGINNVQNISRIEAGKVSQRYQPAADVKAELWFSYYLALQERKDILDASHDVWFSGWPACLLFKSSILNITEDTFRSIS